MRFNDVLMHSNIYNANVGRLYSGELGRCCVSKTHCINVIIYYDVLIEFDKSFVVNAIIGIRTICAYVAKPNKIVAYIIILTFHRVRGNGKIRVLSRREYRSDRVPYRYCQITIYKRTRQVQHRSTGFSGRRFDRPIYRNLTYMAIKYRVRCRLKTVRCIIRDIILHC